MTTKPLWFATVLAACTANAASPEPSTRGHACAPASADDLVPHDVLRIATSDGSADLLVHAWTDRDGVLVDVHTQWQPSVYALSRPGVEVERVGVDAWRVVIIEGATRHELRIATNDDGDVLALASIVTGDDEPTWCRLHGARLISPRLGRVLAGAGRIEARCEDASGTEVEGWVARAAD